MLDILLIIFFIIFFSIITLTIFHSHRIHSQYFYSNWFNDTKLVDFDSQNILENVSGTIESETSLKTNFLFKLVIKTLDMRSILAVAEGSFAPLSSDKSVSQITNGLGDLNIRISNGIVTTDIEFGEAKVVYKGKFIGSINFNKKEILDKNNQKIASFSENIAPDYKMSLKVNMHNGNVIEISVPPYLHSKENSILIKIITYPVAFTNNEKILVFVFSVLAAGITAFRCNVNYGIG